MSVALDVTLDDVRGEYCAPNFDAEIRRIEKAVGQRILLLDDDMTIVFAVEEDGPEFAKCFLRGGFRTEERIADPKSYGARGVIGAQKKALIMSVGLTLKSGVIDLLVENL